MKNITFKFKNLGDMYKNLDLSQIDANKSLVQIFSGLCKRKEIVQIQNILKERYPSLNYIGSTTSGEIYEGVTTENEIIISILNFEHTTTQYFYAKEESDFQTGVCLANTLFKENTKAMILFIDGLDSNGNDIIDGISSVNSNIPIAGGLAGDNGDFKETFVFDKNNIYKKGVVAVALNSDKLNVFTDYQLNWQPIGHTMTVTKAKKNHLYELNHTPASEVYKKYLGEKIGNNLPFSATEFPLLKLHDESDFQVCRTFINKFDDGSLITIGNLEEGDKVRFAFGNVDLILNNTKKNILEYENFEPEVIYTYSCTARKAFLQSQIDIELNPLNTIAPTYGFFTYGEVFHKNNKNSLLNVSLTILAFSEKTNKINTKSKKKIIDEKLEKNIISNKHYLVLDALTNLSNKVIEELEEVHKKLKEEANKDYLTNLYNKRYFDEVSHNLIEIAKRQNSPISVIMIDIDFFKNINDTYGHIVGDEVIKNIASLLIKNTRKSDIVSRFGGEEFAILLPNTNKKDAKEIAEKLRNIIEEHIIILENTKEIKLTISLGVCQMNLKCDENISKVIDNADIALYQAKKQGRNKVIIN
ncbi:sensor domain-containing diguanylate cyclase [Arcobacter sp. YIC-310]|uniref:sensor domain-containing diguanylate cyclase n=1 Tax=Arcobacter sp. YIC-310 TaxID=3376632 RepID=UPI003C15C1DC